VIPVPAKAPHRGAFSLVLRLAGEKAESHAQASDKPSHGRLPRWGEAILPPFMENNQ
jgi:hypothetical protein